MRLYDQLVEAGEQTDRHQSDLYVKKTKSAIDIINAYEKENSLKTGYRFFCCNITGEQWIDIPFACINEAIEDHKKWLSSPTWRRK